MATEHCPTCQYVVVTSPSLPAIKWCPKCRTGMEYTAQTVAIPQTGVYRQWLRAHGREDVADQEEAR